MRRQKCRCSFLSCRECKSTMDNDTALIAATEGGHMDCMQLLIDAGADKEAKGKVRITM